MHEGEDHEAACAGPEKSVVETQHRAHEQSPRPFLAGRQARPRNHAETRLDHRIDQHQNQQAEHQRPHHVLRHPRHRHGPGKGKKEGCRSGRQSQPPGQRNPSCITQRRVAGTEDAGQFVGAEHRRRCLRRQGHQQGRHLYQAAPSRHRVDETCKQRSSEEHDHIDLGHAAPPTCLCRSGKKSLPGDHRRKTPR